MYQRFQQLDQLLYKTSSYWQLVAFEQDSIPWLELAPSLLALTEQELHHLEQHPDALHAWLLPFIPELGDIQSLSTLTRLQDLPLTLPFWLETGVKGRKLDQLKAFVSSLGKINGNWLEWCAGKAHLGRMLAYQGASKVVALELQQALCEDGDKTAKKQGLPVEFVCTNVLEFAQSEHWQKVDHGIALHACGRLHQEFMRQGVLHGCKSLSFSPCCYHLYTPASYQPMSIAGQHSLLRLSHSDLKLALQETVTAPTRINAVRAREVTWRLAFDQLVRDVTGINQYVNVPSVGKQIFSGEFIDFCHWAANEKGIVLPPDIDAARYLALGAQRYQLTERIELVRHAFRRAIEIWLVLDRVLYLQAAGYDVEVFEFCDKALTPRNVFISAVLKN